MHMTSFADQVLLLQDHGFGLSANRLIQGMVRSQSIWVLKLSPTIASPEWKEASHTQTVVRPAVQERYSATGSQRKAIIHSHV